MVGSLGYGDNATHSISIRSAKVYDKAQPLLVTVRFAIRFKTLSVAREAVNSFGIAMMQPGRSTPKMAETDEFQLFLLFNLPLSQRNDSAAFKSILDKWS
jgi:hypothetical protein